MKLKGFKKLQKKLDKLAKEIDDGVSVELATADECFITLKIIRFNLLRLSYADQIYKEHLDENYSDRVKLPEYIYSFLHEMGHIQTAEIFLAEDKEERKVAKGDNTLYFNLESEKAATAWAMDYAKENTVFVHWLTIQFERAINKFLAKNLTE